MKSPVTSAAATDRFPVPLLAARLMMPNATSAIPDNDKAVRCSPAKTAAPSVTVGEDEKNAVADLQPRGQKQVGPARRGRQRQQDGKGQGDDGHGEAHDGDRPQPVAAAPQYGIPRRMEDCGAKHECDDSGSHRTALRPVCGGHEPTRLNMDATIPPPALPGSGSRGRPYRTSQPRSAPPGEASTMTRNDAVCKSPRR